MDAMSSHSKLKNNFSSLLKQVSRDFPDINFKPGDTFRWSSETNTVYYDVSADHACWSLLHEAGHVSRGHSGYKSDSRLVRMEVEAWETALQIAGRYGITIDEDYVQDCIDSYRNWQYSRSKCPRCAQTGAEHTNGLYKCINCREEWQVSPNRFCRVYRRRSAASSGSSAK